MIENLDVEFKELDRFKGTLPDSTAKEIAAFANSSGGTMYIGIRNDGTVAGVDDPDDVMTRLSNTIHDSILPDVIPFVQIRCIEMEGKHVVQATVSVGTERPYYLAREGLKPKGVYVRRGSSCVPVNEAGIREMIMETSGKSFEESRSLNQDLTFEAFQSEMTKRSLEFGQAQMKTLKLIGADGLFTNLARDTHGTSEAAAVIFPDETETIVEFVRKKGAASRKDIETELHVGSTKAYKLLRRLCDEGILQTQGQGNQTAYTLAR